MRLLGGSQRQRLYLVMVNSSLLPRCRLAQHLKRLVGMRSRGLLSWSQLRSARVVQKEVRDPLTDHILFGSLEHGGTVTIGVKENALSFDYVAKN